MRRSLTWTVAAAVSMVLLAMLVPMTVLLRAYALEDRIARAALEVQATETIVSGAADDRGTVEGYLDRINTGDGTTTWVLYPEGRSRVLGPDPKPEQGVRVAQARARGTARLDDVDGGAVILVPVSLARSTGGADRTPVVQVLVETPGLGSPLLRSWLVLALLGVLLLVAALLLAGRLGRSFTGPIGRLAAYAAALGERRHPDPVPVEGPPEVRELAETVNQLVRRIEVLLTRERAQVADLSHRLRTPMTALRLRVDGLAERPGGSPRPDDDARDREERRRLSDDLDALQAAVDQVVAEARRSEREGLVASADPVAVARERVAFWGPLAEDQGRPVELRVDPRCEQGHGPGVRVRCAGADLAAAVDVLLDNVFSHTSEDAALLVRVEPSSDGGARVVVADAGPGLASTDLVARGVSGAGSTGLGLSIAARTAEESGGSLGLGRSEELGGAEVVLVLGPA